MPNYIAGNLGGIGNSGVYPDSKPQINIADTIGAISKAYQNNKEGVLQRAVMQAQNQREQQASDLAKATAGTNGILPTNVAHDFVGQNNDAFEKQSALENTSAPPPLQITPSRQSPSPSGPALPGVGGLPSPGSVNGIMPQTTSSGADVLGNSQPQVPSDRLSTHVPGAPHVFGSRRLSMPIDLGNGYSIIPEMTAAGRAYDLLNARVEGMLQGRMITGQFGNERADIAGGYHMAGIGEQQTGANQRTDKNNEARSDLADQKGALTLQQIAARGHTQMAVAQYRGGLKADPKNMTPVQRATLYQKLGQMYVGGANGDAGEAMATAANDPHLKEFGVTPDQLHGYIGAAAMSVKQKQDAGDTQGALHLLSSYVATTPEQAAATVHATHKAVAPAKPSAAPTTVPDQAAYDELRQGGMTDQEIGKRYAVPSTIKRH